MQEVRAGYRQRQTVRRLNPKWMLIMLINSPQPNSLRKRSRWQVISHGKVATSGDVICEWGKGVITMKNNAINKCCGEDWDNRSDGNGVQNRRNPIWSGLWTLGMSNNRITRHKKTWDIPLLSSKFSNLFSVQFQKKDRNADTGWFPILLGIRPTTGSAGGSRCLRRFSSGLGHRCRPITFSPEALRSEKKETPSLPVINFRDQSRRFEFEKKTNFECVFLWSWKRICPSRLVFPSPDREGRKRLLLWRTLFSNGRSGPGSREPR